MVIAKIVIIIIIGKEIMLNYEYLSLMPFL